MAARKSAISPSSDHPSVAEDPTSNPRARKEVGDVNKPPMLPTAPGLTDWMIKVATALVQAFAYGDQAEVAWLRECSDPNHDIDY